MEKFIRKYSFVIAFSALGALGGFLYWKFVGCLTGTCPIKSIWYMSTLYGLVLGYVTGGLIEEIVIKIKNRKKYE